MELNPGKTEWEQAWFCHCGLKLADNPAIPCPECGCIDGRELKTYRYWKNRQVGDLMKSGNIAKYKEEYVIIISNIYPGSGVLVKNKDGVEISVHKKELRIMYDNALDAIEKLHKLIEVKDMMINSMLQACEKIVEHVKNDLDEKIGGTDADA